MIVISYFRRILMEIIKRALYFIHPCHIKKSVLYYGLLLIVVFVVSAILTCRLKRAVFAEIDLQNTHIMLQEDLKNSVQVRKGKGCVQPALDPFEKEIVEHDVELPPTSCSGSDWVECFLEECYVVPTIRDELKDTFCVYRDIVYVTDREHRLGPSWKLTADQKYILKASDHVQVTCLGKIGESGTPLQWSGYKTGLRRVRSTLKTPCCGPRINVLMLCLHSMSKSGFIRRMPRSYGELRSMGALFINGFNIVGEGSSATLFPILTGRTVLELPEFRKRFTKDFLDENKFLFIDLFKMGYRTAYFDDSRPVGIFQDMFNGFVEQPTDHYLLPLIKEEFVNGSKGNYSFCMGDTPFYGVALNLTHQFSQLTGNRFSLTFLSDIGREDFTMRSAADQDLAFFLRRIQQGGKLKETVLFVMGDHGPSSSSIRDTSQGRLEERLPLLAILVPDYLKQTRPKAAAAVGANTEVLVTPFDIHATLTDILGIGDQRNRYRVPGADMERGKTLLQPIPALRSCEEAGVAPHWCACAAWRPLPSHDPLWKEIGDLVVDYINSMTNEWRYLCAKQKLLSTDYVHILRPVEIQNNNFSYYYQAKVTLTPGGSVFQATLRYFVKTDFFAISEHDISRVNAYANDSTCVVNDMSTHLKKYCYCNDNKPNLLQGLFYD